ncbi:MAG: ubiquinone/menaquinone biosynthesis methyltransferase [Candidatus Omnitrophica bacterium]|nr:ubiquinone/menaquinone biosynthesis methyltransferase [Candidatus Omnitrophota bacterium]
MRKKSSLVSDIFSRIAARYEAFNLVASFGMVKLWRQALAGSLSPSGTLQRKNGVLLDLCTGTGEVIREVHRIAPQIEAVGIDASLEMLGRFRNGNSNAVLSCAEKLPFKEGIFDAVTGAFGMRNLSDLDSALCEVSRVLRKGGEFAILEFSQPRCPVMRFLHEIFLRFYIPLVGFIVTGALKPFIYLGTSILKFDDIDKLKARFSRCGFEAVGVRELAFGAVGLYKLRKL